MTEAEVITVMRRFLEGKFPKRCHVCGRTYADLRDYLLHTRHVGQPHSHDAEMGDFRPDRPIGAMSMANCGCGNTLAIDSTGMDLGTMWRLMAWLAGEMAARGQTASEVLAHVRRRIDEETLAESAPPTHRH